MIPTAKLKSSFNNLPTVC